MGAGAASQMGREGGCPALLRTRPTGMAAGALSHSRAKDPGAPVPSLTQRTKRKKERAARALERLLSDNWFLQNVNFI